MSNTQLLAIGEVATALNRSIDTIRRWDRQNWLKPSVRRWDGTRLYRTDYIEHFRNLLNQGMSPQKALEQIYEQYHPQSEALVEAS
ncbi:MerR family DNA-binding transcriptional regulator [Leptolyngbya sp. FACHB-16]|uniref:MerR family transcriptional regulator n=1 Tax=unclassified Leptolyngbya TaxID=2650499 RepID=UPI001688AC90|nr:MerR family DNA-binding transcriptional regulator [Leptolyngbya sp. FACHB-16]MBD2157317.1 MerR family transcriptional regulator [Leptolyngbya sp. FACHB-16]